MKIFAVVLTNACLIVSLLLPSSTLARDQELPILLLKASTHAYDVTHEGRVRAWDEDNLTDNNLKTIWCTWDNTEEWVYLILPQVSQVSEVGFINGNGTWKKSGNSTMFYRDARLKDLRLDFSNGKSQTIRLEDNGKLQTFPIDSQKTFFVKVTVLSLYPSIDWSHACLSEVKLFGE